MADLQVRDSFKVAKARRHMSRCGMRLETAASTRPAHLDFASRPDARRRRRRPRALDVPPRAALRTAPILVPSTLRVENTSSA